MTTTTTNDLNMVSASIHAFFSRTNNTHEDEAMLPNDIAVLPNNDDAVASDHDVTAADDVIVVVHDDCSSSGEEDERNDVEDSFDINNVVNDDEDVGETGEDEVDSD
jgi:hypothetical protein